MNAQAYCQAIHFARGWARGSYPKAISKGEISRLKVRVGIYFACVRTGDLDYIGSAVRPSDRCGVARRIVQHSEARRKLWKEFWVVPFKEDTPEVIVRAIEGQMIDYFRPTGNLRIHSVRSVPRYRGTSAGHNTL